MTSIEWTHRPGTKGEVWNFITGCDKVSQGCKFCYAEVMHRRLQHMQPKKYDHPFLGHVKVHPEEMTKPKKWKKPRTVFVNSMSDVFHKDVEFQFIIEAFHVMRECPQHTFIILTKRLDRALEFFTECAYNPYGTPFNPLPNVWIVASVEDQKTADERVPLLLQIPAAVRGLSCEPLLGEINLNRINHVKYPGGSEHYQIATLGIDWVIAGGESGGKARPVNPAWIISLRDQCQAAGVPFFFKQWGAWKWSGMNSRKENIGTWKEERHPTTGMDAGPTDGVYVMVKVGKKKSGNLLGGVRHLEFPK